MIRALSLDGPALWICLWQSTVVAVIGLAGSYLLARRPARRFQILLLTMIAALLVPVMSLLVKHYDLGVLAAEPMPYSLEVRDLSATIPEEIPAAFEPESQIQADDPVETPAKATPLSAGASVSWRTVFVCGWMIATLVLLGRLLAAIANGVCLLRRSQWGADRHIQEAADTARARLGITEALSIRSSSEIHGPMIWCWSKSPVLLVPRASDDGVDWVGVICHELAHWSRRDHISGLTAELIVCLVAWNPLLWWSKRRMIRLGEQACDDWVVAAGHSAEKYARALLNFRPQRQASFAPAVVNSRKGVAARVRRILNDACGNPRTGTKWALGVTALVACAAVGLAFAQARPSQPDATTARPEEPTSQSANKPAVDTEESEQPRFAARTFNSKMAFSVWYQPARLWAKEWSQCGPTPSATPVQIPACGLWWVKTEQAVTDWDLLIREIKENEVPGLMLPWRQCMDSDLTRLAELTELYYLDLAGGPITDAGLEDLKSLTGLQALGLSGTPIADAGLEHLKNLRGLQALDLSGTRITDAGLAHLQDLPALQALWPPDQIGDAGLEHLKALSELRRLGLNGTRITDAGLEHLKSLSRLQSLDLSDTKITDAGLAPLKSLSELRTLYLRTTGITGAGLVYIKDLTGLRQLDLTRSPITDAGLVHLKDLTGLERLDLNNSHVSDAGMEYLKNLTRLRYLNLAMDSITDAGLVHLKGLTGLRALDLIGTRITDAGLAQLKDLTGLQTLSLTGTQITDGGFECLKSLPKLQALDLDGTKITDAGLSRLKDMPSLLSLMLIRTQISDAGLAHLEGLKGLGCLWLPDQISDAGLEHLKGLTEMESLMLSGTQITDAGLKYLNNMSKLKALYLRTAGVTDAGLEHLKSLAALEEVSLTGTQVTDAGVQHLRQSLPKLRVQWYPMPPGQSATATACPQPVTPSVPQEPVAKPAYDLAAIEAWRVKHLAEEKALWQQRNAALAEGRIKRGMTYAEFMKVWHPGRPVQEPPGFGHSTGGGMMTANAIDNTEPRSRQFAFNFFNGVLVSWTDSDHVSAGWAGLGTGGTVMPITSTSGQAEPTEQSFIAKDPNPADGAIDVTSPLFRWTAGPSAMMDTVYLGTNPNPGPSELRRRQPSRAAGFFYTGPLEPGTKYYWRVDSFDKGRGLHTGKVWSFTTKPAEATDHGE